MPSTRILPPGFAGTISKAAVAVAEVLMLTIPCSNLHVLSFNWVLVSEQVRVSLFFCVPLHSFISGDDVIKKLQLRQI